MVEVAVGLLPAPPPPQPATIRLAAAIMPIREALWQISKNVIQNPPETR
jgi:hypothetical protein